MIYVVCNAYYPDTAYTNRVLSFIRGFSELGVDVEIVFLAPDLKRSKVNESYSHVTFNYMWEKMPFSNRFVNKFIEDYNGRKFVRNLQYGDVVFLTCFGRICFRLFGKKGVRVFHEKTEHPDIYKIRGFNVERYKSMVHLVDGMFVISTALRDYFIFLGVAKEKIHIVNMIADKNRFVDLKKNTVEKYIAYCGTISNNKDGVDDLIRSFDIVHKKYPNVKLYVIGPNYSQHDRSGNLRLIHNLGLVDSVVFTGIVSADSIPQILKNAEVLALDRPNSLQARCGFPTKLGEYLLTENPVVVTKVGDIPLFLKDGQTALLSDEGNPYEFASKLLWALDHPIEASKIGRAGAQVAMKQFNNIIETKKIVDIIKRD